MKGRPGAHAQQAREKNRKSTAAKTKKQAHNCGTMLMTTWYINSSRRCLAATDICLYRSNGGSSEKTKMHQKDSRRNPEREVACSQNKKKAPAVG